MAKQQHVRVEVKPLITKKVPKMCKGGKVKK